MPEPRWLRPLARAYLIVTTAVWVTASGLRLARWLTVEAGECAVRGTKRALPLCEALEPPVWALAIVGVAGVLAAWLAARLTRPRVV